MRVSLSSRSSRRPMLAAAVRRCSQQVAVCYGGRLSLRVPLQHTPMRPQLASWVNPCNVATLCRATTEAKHENLIKHFIRELDTDALIQLKDDGGEIYSEAFTKGRSITKLTPEELRRAMLVAHLVYKKGYSPSDISLEHLLDNRRLDVLLRRPCGAGYMYAECKRQLKPEMVEGILREQIYPFVPPLGSDAETHKRQRFGLIFSSRLTSDERVELNKVLVDLETYPTLAAYKQGRGISGDATTPIPERYEHPEDGDKLYGNVDTPTSLLKPLSRDATPDELERCRRRMHNLLWRGGGSSFNDVYRVMVEVRTHQPHSSLPPAASLSAPHSVLSRQRSPPSGRLLTSLCAFACSSCYAVSTTNGIRKRTKNTSFRITRKKALTCFSKG